ncbi:pentatricopeptide repeat-containing protein At1g52640, mitochondrial-like [Aristolochia californica]|uniref:pentatricopeptide repeat-containing protein At1g52640, mitochondrial-like n=1 Tax=Aristolochia californica TaxID=171875 RepID=UPI0035D60B42
MSTTVVNMAMKILFSVDGNLKVLIHSHPYQMFQLSKFGSICSFSRWRFLSGTTLLDSDPCNLQQDVNEISRVLSDFRGPHHDIESALHQFCGKISTNMVEQVLKRCRNLGVSSHRFFLWAQKLSNFSHSRESYHILVDILGSCKQFPLVWDFLLQMREGRIEINQKIFWVIFQAYCKAKLPADAINAFKRMTEFGLEQSIEDLEVLLSYLCKNSLVTHAQDFFDRAKLEFVVGPKTYSILMKGWGDSETPSEALKLYEEMLLQKCPVDVIAYNTLMASLCKGGMVDEAYRLLQKMRSHGLEANACTYSIFIHVSCRENDVHSAMRILDRMRRYSLVSNVFTYNSIIKLLCNNSGIDDAYKLLDEMMEGGLIPDAWSYNAILATHCNMREVNRALGLLGRMKRDSCRPDRHTYNMLLKMLIEVGRVDRAMEVWNGMEDMGFYPSVTTYTVMIHGLCKKKGRMGDACKYFEMMVDEGIPPYSCTCDLLRDRLLHFGSQDMIYILADKMRRSTSHSIQELADRMSNPSSNV